VPLRDDLTSWGLEPANDEQRYLMDLLLNDEIKLVTVSGIAGTGKSLLATACALRQVTDDFTYRKLLISRPVVPMGRDIGFLPGSAREKLDPYMAPIYDAVEYLMSGGIADIKPVGKKRGRKSKDEEEKEYGKMGKGLLELEAAGIIEVEALLYIRGRSIPNVIMIIDEVQNLTRHEIKTIVSRSGKGTKLIFTGDIDQIDAPYLDASSNGLTYLIDKFQDQKIAGHITLVKGERSELAEIATQIL
jgi:PhoH-like ATPase